MNKSINWLWVGVVLVLFGLLSLGQLQRFQVTPTLAIYGHDLILGGLVGGWSLLHWRRIRALRPRVILGFGQKQPALIGLLGLILFNSVMATIFQHSVSHWLYLFRLMLYVLSTWILLHKMPPLLIFRKRIGMDWMYPVLGLSWLYLGLLQYLFLPDTRFLYVLGWDDHYYRLIGTQLDPAFTGALLVLTFFSLEKWIKNRWAFFLRLLLVAAIALTFSRATFVSLGAGLVVYLYLSWCRHQPRWQLLIFGPWLLLCLWLAPKPTGEGVNLTRTSTIVARSAATASWIQDLSVEEWLLGRGLFVTPTITKDKQSTDALYDHANAPDNLPVLVVTGLGLVGMLLLLTLIWQSRGYFETAPTWLVAASLAVLTHSGFNNTLFQPFVWLFIVGLVMSSQVEATASKRV